MQNNIISLFDLTLMLESFIDDSFGGKYFLVTAEISSINVRRGHCYLNLIHKDPGSVFPKAEMKGMIWQNNYERINAKFSAVTGFSLKQDINILFMASVNYSPRYGLSLNIFDIKGEYTLGEMMQDKQKTVEQLKKSGLYDKNKQLQFPLVPQRIAALSASDSKGFEDFLNILASNPYGYKFFVKLFPVMLQGNKAAESIASQLQLLEKEIHKFDLVVIVRGGGGNVDLHCFNSFSLAEAIALCKLPAITGIGHTTDFTVADEVAAMHKETPTAVAQHIVNACALFENSVSDTAEKVSRASLRLLDSEEYSLEKAAAHIKYKPKIFTQKHKFQLSRIASFISSAPLTSIRIEKSSIENAKQNMGTLTFRMINQELLRIENQEKLIQAHNPMLLLRKGYSITRFGGKSIKHIEHLKHGDEIETFTAGGKLLSKVHSIENK